MLVTAKHCLTGSPADRFTIYAKMGQQRVALLTSWALHPTWDVAAAKLTSPMQMWNFRYGKFLTSPGKITNNGYGRTIHAGGNKSLDPSSVLCWGFGGNSAATPAPPLTYAALNTSTYASDRLFPPVRNSPGEDQQHAAGGG